MATDKSDRSIASLHAGINRRKREEETSDLWLIKSLNLQVVENK